MAKSKRYRRHKRKSRKTRNRRHKQKPIMMIGCSKSSCPNCGPNCHCCPNCNCPHPCPGNCYLNRRKHKGGSGCGPNGCPIPPMSYSQMNKYGGGGDSPFIGKPWGPSVNQWPGVNDSRNHLMPYDVSKDPQYLTNSRQSGGGLIPQDLVNLGRDFTFNMKSTYNALNGVSAPVNPLPYKDQLSSANKILI